MTRLRLAMLVLLLGPAAVPAQQRDVDPHTTFRERESVSLISVGRVDAPAGATVTLPVAVRDGFGSPLGVERAAGADVQSLALRVRVVPKDAVVGLRVERAGVAARATPRFEAAPRTDDGIAYLAVFDPAGVPLALRPRVTNTIAVLHVTLAPQLPRGTRVELRLDPAATILANVAGTAQESVGNGWVELRDGLVTVR
jgi:hypothetical protein